MKLTLIQGRVYIRRDKIPNATLQCTKKASNQMSTENLGWLRGSLDSIHFTYSLHSIILDPMFNLFIVHPNLTLFFVSSTFIFWFFTLNLHYSYYQIIFYIEFLGIQPIHNRPYFSFLLSFEGSPLLVDILMLSNMLVPKHIFISSTFGHHLLAQC